MIQIDCAVEAGDWPDLTTCQSFAERAVDAAVALLNEPLPDNAEVSLLFADDSTVQVLNARWRDQDKPTNVLSFAVNEGHGATSPMLGDIILAQQTIAREAVEQAKAFEDHLSHLIVHGFLHLMGYDHINDEDAEIMENLERKICASLGIADPYAEH